MESEATELVGVTAFAGTRLIASGSLREVVHRAWEHVGQSGQAPLLVFDDATGKTVDVDLHGSLEEALARVPEEPSGAPEHRPGPGRPKLGVVAREVTLLPRHWDWLATQPGGASVALRKLVEAARKQNAGKDLARARRDAAHTFMWAMAGDLEGFEEASRALYAADYARLDQLVEEWPADVRDHARRLVLALVAAERAAEAGGQPEANRAGGGRTAD
jgi:uncharacterized protein